MQINPTSTYSPVAMQNNPGFGKLVGDAEAAISKVIGPEPMTSKLNMTLSALKEKWMMFRRHKLLIGVDESGKLNVTYPPESLFNVASVFNPKFKERGLNPKGFDINPTNLNALHEILSSAVW